MFLTQMRHVNEDHASDHNDQSINQPHTTFPKCHSHFRVLEIPLQGLVYRFWLDDGYWLFGATLAQNSQLMRISAENNLRFLDNIFIPYSFSDL